MSTTTATNNTTTTTTTTSTATHSTSSNHCGSICTNNHQNNIIDNNNKYCNNNHNHSSNNNSNSFESRIHSKGSKLVSLTIVGARDLRKKDGGKIDPFVEVRYNDKSWSTKTIKNTNNPVWDETFDILIKEQDKAIQSIIYIYVYGREIIFKNNDIGYATLSLSSILQENVFENWLEISDSQGQTGFIGHLHIRAQLFTSDDIDFDVDDWKFLNNKNNDSANSSTSGGSLKSSPSSSYNDINNNYYYNDFNFNNNSNNNKPTTTTTTTTTTSSSSCKGSGTSNSNSNNNNNNNNNNNIYIENDKDNQSLVSSLVYHQQLQLQQLQKKNYQQYQQLFELNGSIDIDVLRLILEEQEHEQQELNNDLDMLSHCIICKKFEEHAENLFLMDDCLHNFCRSCLKSGIIDQMNRSMDQIYCPFDGCQEKIHQVMMKSVLDKSEFEQFENKQLEQVLYNSDKYIKCPHCKEVFERIEQPPLSPPLISTSSANTTATTSASTSPLPQSLSNSLSNSSFASITSLLTSSSNSNFFNSNNNNNNNNNSTTTTTTNSKKRAKLNLHAPDGTLMSEEAARHREEYRFRCKCSTEFCSNCTTSPYHYSYTCEKYHEYLTSRKCRFCSSPIKEINGGSGKQRDICFNEECQEKLDTCCDKTLGCGHPCIGVKGEKRCEPCFEIECVPKGHFNNEEICSICYVESIKSAPSIMLECGHMFHYSCVEKRLTSKTGPRLTFHHADCPVCKKQMKLHPAINHLLEPILKTKAIIQSKSMERLSYEGLTKCKEIEDRSSKWYQDPENYSMDRYVYYTCFKCKCFYFAGQARCDEGMDGSYKEEDLVCGNCRTTEFKECKIHGWDYIIWKCQFCCSVAQWYCWNKVHFCTDCHTKQQKGDYLNKKPKSAIPMCEGPDKCPLKVDHPHCTEYMLGCTLCKNLKEF